LGGGIDNAGPMTLSHTIVAGNTASAGGPDCQGGATSNGYNLLGINSSCTFATTSGDQTGTSINPLNAQLGALASNGGPTQTHALLAVSPAMDAGNPNGCADASGNFLTTDQRGTTRRLDGDRNGTATCDIGAYEFVPAPLPPVDCSLTSLQSVVNIALPGDILSVSGTCNENILIRNEKQRVTLDGGGTAVLHGPSTGSPTLNIRGKGILIQGFTITGGGDGIEVDRGSNAVLNNNLIQNTAGNGVLVDQLAFAVLTNNTLQNNPGAGVLVDEHATARIGLNADGEITASPNTIQNNAIGVLVSNGASARIIGNTIVNNSGDGIQVLRDSQADIASNSISGNGGDGIEVAENSAVQLGEDSGTSIHESPNSSSTANSGFGIRCVNGAIADGRLGTLNGMGGAKDFSAASCLDGLL